MGYMFQMTFVEPLKKAPLNPRGSIEPSRRATELEEHEGTKTLSLNASQGNSLVHAVDTEEERMLNQAARN